MHKTAVHGFVSTQNSTASINPHGLIREALHDVVQPATPAEMIVLFAGLIAPALILFTCAE